jgi:hypothetical protein
MRKVWITLESGCVEGWYGEWEGKKVLTWKGQFLRTDLDEENPSAIFLTRDSYDVFDGRWCLEGGVEDRLLNSI